jgi:hypothetical protein
MNTQENQITKSLITRQRVPFEKEVLKFLLNHEASITSAVVRDFVRRYVKWLYDCSNQEATIVPGGGVELVRWTTKEGGSYGYKPGDIAYCLLKLNQLFFTVMGNAYIRLTQQDMVEELPPLNTQLSIELLKGLSPCLGFFVLITYLAAGATQSDQAWVRRACDLFGEFGDLETWRPERAIETSVFVLRVLASTQSPDDPYYNDVFPKNIRAPEPQSYTLGQIPAVPVPSNYKDSYGNLSAYGQAYEQGYSSGYRSGHAVGYRQCVDETNRQFSKAAFIVECERKRLVDFIKSLRQALDVLNDDPLLVEGEWQVTTPEGKPTNGYHSNEGRED